MHVEIFSAVHVAPRSLPQPLTLNFHVSFGAQPNLILGTGILFQQTAASPLARFHFSLRFPFPLIETCLVFLFQGREVKLGAKATCHRLLQDAYTL